MRHKIVAGNWKMNNTVVETESLLQEIIAKKQATDTKVIVAPSFVNLQTALNLTQGTDIIVAAQNAHQNKNGAFTGEVSLEMLKAIGINTVILGHSERRAYFNETNQILSQKVKAALADGFTIIYCFGEELHDRKSNKHFEVVATQVKEVLFDLDPSLWSQIILAYEPVWAIGTGETASAEQAQEIHKFVRDLIAEQFGTPIADQVAILYGGSVKPDNAKEIFSQPDVDGGLIGGAALKADDFLQIIASA